MITHEMPASATQTPRHNTDPTAAAHHREEHAKRHPTLRQRLVRLGERIAGR